MIPSSTHYDLILAGGGMAGLSLAYYLNNSPLREKKILIIDREPKEKNDRTWAFWERENGPFEPILFRQWPTVWFHGPRGDGPRGDGTRSGFSEKLDLGGYRYKLLRGIDFYDFVRAELAKNANVEFLYSPILKIESTEHHAVVLTEAGRFSAGWVFDSTFRLEAMKPFNAKFRMLNAELETQKNHSAFSIQHSVFQTLLQHFKGWVVKTPLPAFNPDEPVMMDFRIPQHGECRFMYVLPFSETEALVEFTLFTPALLPPDAYDAELKTYLRDFLNMNDFEIRETEFGIIPMTDEPTTERPGPRVVRIGTAGGTTRPSTGYTFARTQRRLHTIARNLAADFNAHPLDGEGAAILARYRFFDEIFLNVFLKKRHPPAQIFTQLYARNRPADVFAFLDEETTLAEDLRVIWAAPKLPFTRAAIDVLLRKIRP